MSDAEKKLQEARDTLSTIIKMIDDRTGATKAGVMLDLVRSEAVDCLDRVREE